jgi:CheY-like chemotaxis protein
VKEERRILIVDDDRDSTHLIKSILEKTGGYLVLEENDAAKAHRSAQNFRPDLILLDIMMPQTDGVDIASEIDADPQLQRTPIIFLTALVTKSDARAGLRIQGHPVLAKPINGFVHRSPCGGVPSPNNPRKDGSDSIKPTALSRSKFIVFATTPRRGLSLFSLDG